VFGCNCKTSITFIKNKKQIYDAIVNSSSIWGIQAKNTFNNNKSIIQLLVCRYLAWLTMFRYQLIEERVSKTIHLKCNKYGKFYNVVEQEIKIEDELIYVLC
jgi:hypothetical protein